MNKKPSRESVGLVLGPLLFVAIALVPLGIPPQVQRMMAVAALMATWWVSEAIPLAATSLLPLALFPLLGLGSAQESATPYANHLVYLFLGGFMLAMLTIGYFLVLQRPRLRTQPEITNAVTLMVILIGAFLLASRFYLQAALPNLAVGGIVDILVMHLAVSLLMPWPPKETSLPFAPLLLIWAVVFLVPHAAQLEPFDRVVVVIMSPVVLLPGVSCNA